MGGDKRERHDQKQGQSTSSNSCNGHSNLSKRLMSRSQVPVIQQRGLTLLHLAAREEDIALDIAQAILICGCIPINLQTLDGGVTPLHIASNRGQVNMVKLFLEQEGINVNIRDKYMFTSLRAAAQNGHTEVVKLLLACEDNDVNLADIFGYTPLHMAVIQNNETVVQILLTCVTIDVNIKDFRSANTPLHYASLPGHVGAVRLLVEHKDIDLNLQNKKGVTAISSAATIGHVEVVKILLGCVGIDINKSDSDGATPLMIAAGTGHVEVVKILLGCVGIDINKSSSEGATSLLIAAYKGHVEVVKILLNSDVIDINKSSSEGATPLMKAVQKGHVEVVKILLGCVGIDINMPNSTGHTPLMLAVDENGETDLLVNTHIDMILQIVCPIMASQTDLHFNTHRIDIVKALVANKTININAETQNHDTAFHFAAGSGNSKVVRILLDLYKKDKHIHFKKENLAGETALSLAQGRNYVEVVDVITKHVKKMERRKKLSMMLNCKKQSQL